MLLALPVPPDAIVCASDSLALGASMQATASGAADLPIIGFDNTPVASAVGLSSIDQPLDDVVAAALTMLFGNEGDTVLPNPRRTRSRRIGSSCLDLSNAGLPTVCSARPPEPEAPAITHRKETS